MSATTANISPTNSTGATTGARLKDTKRNGNENTATVWSNANWRLFVRAAGPAFTESPTGANTIPLNRLRVTGTRGVNLGVNDKRIANGAATGTAGVAVPINYALTLRFADKANTPGSNYQQILIYTAVTP